MKKFLALLLAVMMLSVSAFALAEEETGFDEYELGVEGEQDVGFMTMSMVYFQPVDMAPADLAAAKEDSDLHIEVDLTANENPYFDNISDEDIIGVNIPTGTPLVYEFNDDFKVIKSYYLGDQEALRAKMEAVANQGKKK